MSKVFVSLVTMSGKAIGGKEPVAIPDSKVYGKQLLESVGTNVVSTLSVTSALADNDELVWLIRGLSGNSWLKFDPTPVAAVGDDWLVMEGDLLAVSAKKLDKFAIIQG